MKSIALGCLLSIVSMNSFGQSPLGLNLQVYPAGIITEAEFVVPLEKHHALVLRAGYNFTDRQDFGEHDNEEGGGPGITLGYRYMPKGSSEGWFFGARADLWFLDLDWEDPDRSGSSDIIVFQPTAEVGYSFLWSDLWTLQPFLALGAEINVDTDGEEVGEGAIILAGVSWVLHFD